MSPFRSTTMPATVVARSVSTICSWRVLSAQSKQTGQFRLKDVPPGDYLAVAVQGLPFLAWTNADVLIRLQSIATKLTVNEGEQKVISIRASPSRLAP